MQQHKGGASRTLQGLVLASVLFNIFINDLEERVNKTLIEFTDFNRVRGVINMTEEKNSLKRRLEAQKTGFLLK